MTSWALRRTRSFIKAFTKLDRPIQKQITLQLEIIMLQDDPRSSGTPLVGNFSGYWRYRSGDYRIIAQINDQELTVIAVDVGHRSRIYKR